VTTYRCRTTAKRVEPVLAVEGAHLRGATNRGARTESNGHMQDTPDEVPVPKIHA